MASEQPQAENQGWVDDFVIRLVDALSEPKYLDRFVGLAEAIAFKVFEGGFKALFLATAPIVDGGVSALVSAMAESREARARVLAAVVQDLFGAKVDVTQLRDVATGSGGGVISADVVRAMLSALTGGSTSVEPSAVPAERYVELVVRQALEGWFMGASMELISGVAPHIEQVQLLGEAGNRVAGALGIGDSSSRVLRPYIDNLVVEPLRRKIDSTYRPSLMSVSDIARNYWRGRLTREDVFRELAMQGWDDSKIEMLIDGQRRYLGVSDTRTLFDREEWDAATATQNLRDQGYDADTAGLALRLELIKRQEQHEAQLGAAAVNAYVAGDLTRGDFLGFVDQAIGNAQERSFVRELADARRVLHTKRLSPAEARACVKAGILSVRDYRDALRREGYDEEGVTALELLLRHELDEQRTADELRAMQAAERAAEQAAKAEAAEQRRLELERERALKRRGAEADLEAAAIRGLIPIARVAELYRAKYDAETADIYVALLEDKRELYLAAEQRRADALKRGAQRDISVADVEEAVLANILTLQQYRTRLEHWQFSAEDIDVLVRTLEARKAALDAARRAHADASADAKARGVDLGRFERLVRRGARTLAQYRALLAGFNFDEAAIAAMVELLELEIAEDRKADEARAAAEAKLQARGLSLEQLRRLVVLGLAPRSEFERVLVASGLTGTAQELLLRELDAAVADAEAARRRREAGDRVSDGRALDLSTVRRAARLGLVSPQTYLDRLVAAGYGEEDMAIELDLLFAEIADVQAARTARDAAPAPADGKGLSLPELARAVRAGLKSLEDFRARAVTLGLSADAVATQVRILGDELVETQAAKRRRELLGVELEGRGVGLAALEDAVKAGELTIRAFVEQLTLHGLAPADAELLGHIAVDTLIGIGG